MSEIASAVSTPERVVGLHVFNPVHIMDLVEVVRAEQTDDRTTQFAVEYVEEGKKEPIVVADSAGLATFRCGVASGLAAILMVEAGVASPPTSTLG